MKRRTGGISFGGFLALAFLVLAVTGRLHHLGQPHPAATSSTTSSTTSGNAASVGPGPQSHYTVQAQPAPGTCHYRWLDHSRGLVLPDPACTPGASNPAVTQANIATTICRSGYTRSIRPPEQVTGREKRANERSYGYTGSTRVAEYDHLISLELGGDPNSPKNLWVEPNAAHATGVNNAKDTIENRLNALVCSRQVPLAKAQHAIAANWTTALRAVGHPGG